MAAGEIKLKGMAAIIEVGNFAKVKLRFRVESGGALTENQVKYFIKDMTWDEFVANTTAGERSTLNTVLGKMVDFAKANPPDGWTEISGATIE